MVSPIESILARVNREVLLSLDNLTHLHTADAQTFCSRNFSRASLFSFLNKERFSTLSPQSGGVFLKIGYELGNLGRGG